MDYLIKSIAICVSAAVFSAAMKKTVPELAFSLQIITVVLVLLFVLRLLQPISAFFRNSADYFGSTGMYVQPILKAALIGVMSNIGCSLCKDAGQTAFAAAIELLGTISIFLSALPLLQLFVHTIGELL